MSSARRFIQLGRLIVCTTGLSLAIVSSVKAQENSTVPGEIILYCQSGTPLAEAEALAASVQAQIKPLLLADCYHLILPLAQRNDAETADAVAKLKNSPKVRSVKPNILYKKRQGTVAKVEPNDPRYVAGEQWYLANIKMPQAWALQKGASGITLAVIDEAFNPLHEDMVGKYHAESYNFLDNNTDITFNATVGNHGGQVSSVAVANTNNSKGMAAVCWENIQCIAFKTGLNGVALINSYARVASRAKELKIAAVNMSYGGIGDQNDASQPEYVAVKAMHDAGVICIGAGAEQGAPGNIPNAYPFVINVYASTNNNQQSSFNIFSAAGQLVAPGGDGSGTTSGDILTASDNATAYVAAAGTSFSAPLVTAVAALLRSVPNVTQQQARDALLRGANSLGRPVPDFNQGYGLLDAYRSLALVSANITIDDPIGTDPLGNTTDPSGIPRPVETLRPTLRFTVNQVPLAEANITVTIDGQTIPFSELTTAVETGTATGANPNYTVAIRLPKALARVGEHTLVVQGTNPTTGATSRDERRFTINPHVIPAGTSFISVPYYESAADSPTNMFREAKNESNPASALFGNDVTLYRWLYLPGQVVNNVVQSGGRYAIDAPGTQNDVLPDNAKFRPTDAQTTPGDDTSTIINPVGLGYFLNTPAAISVLTYGVEYTKKSVRVPLHEGWNMIGDPYGYAVSFNTILVEDKAGTRHTAQEASEKGIILPYIYRFVGGEYQFQALPNGVLAPWEGHWIYVVPKNGTPNPAKTLTMIVQPVQGGIVSRSASTSKPIVSNAPRTSGSGSWALRLEARTQNLVDTGNYIGTTTRAASDRLNSVPKPPKPTPYVSLGISKADAPNGIGLYAQDLQTAGGTKTWDVVVNTDQAESDVVVSWPEVRSVPRNVRLTLTDKVSGQSVDLRQQSSFRYNTGRGADPRVFVITAKPSAIAGRALVTNLMVNPVRTNGRSAPVYEINYSLNQDVRVEMSILSASGKIMAAVGNTRAAAVGDNRAVWNGRDNGGRELPAGLYVLQVRAITGDGEMTRSVTSFLMTR